MFDLSSFTIILRTYIFIRYLLGFVILSLHYKKKRFLEKEALEKDLEVYLKVTIREGIM